MEYINLSALPILRTSFRELTDDEKNILIHQRFTKNTYNEISVNSHILEYGPLNQLKEDLMQYLKKYWNDVYNCRQDIKATNSWIARSKPGQRHHRHNHPNCVISLVYYIQAEENCGLLDFHLSPLIYKGHDFTYDIRAHNEYNSKTWSLCVKTGDVVIFPGWIEHETQENNSDKERIILGLNGFPAGQFVSHYAGDLDIQVK